MEDTATQCPPAPPKRVVRFLTEPFDAFAEQHGCASDHDKANLIGCGTATMSRIRAGKQNPGPYFIAAVFAAIKKKGGDPCRFFDFYGVEQ